MATRRPWERWACHVLTYVQGDTHYDMMDLRNSSQTRVRGGMAVFGWSSWGDVSPAHI